MTALSRIVANFSRLAICAGMLITLSMHTTLASAQSNDAPPPPPIPETDTPRATGADTNANGIQPLPPKVQDEELEPTVTIRREGSKTYEEYRADGRIYMIKVTPDNGPPYYLLDTDGDGNLETHNDDQRGQPVKPVYWKLKEWK